jgi:dipeptidyl aminopeptidase/acylaminoacyl peptidase
VIETDGIIRKRETVRLSRAQTGAVEKLYDHSVIENTIVESITYLSDDLHIKGYLVKPKTKGTFPVLIWNRGGSEDRGALDDLTAFLILASTAVWGYVVLASQYRGNMGSEGDDEWGGGDLHDILALIETAKNLPECDETKIAIEGASRGGMNSYRALLKYPQFKCCLIHAGITDGIALMNLKPGFKTYLQERYAGLSEDKIIDEIKKVSPVYFADRLPKNVPVLIMHGTDDTVVPIEQSEWLVEKLKQLNIPHEYRVIPGGTHVALKDGSYKEIDKYRKIWLEKYLK